MTDITLPEGFAEKILAQFDDGAKLLAAIEGGLPVAGMRVNPAKSVDLPYAAQPVPWEPDGFYLRGSARPGQSIEHAAGAFYLQEPSAMAAAPLLGALPGERILDLCASPGGKSGQLAAAMRGEGLLVCNEVDAARVPALVQNLERLGVRNALVTRMRPDALAERLPGFFDRILVDAPCSGEGMFRRDLKSRAQWTRESPAVCARRQSLILKSAARLARPGARIVYSTCTFNRDENESVVRAFAADHPTYTCARMVRVMPHTHDGEGHFAAVLADNRDAPAAEPPILLCDERARSDWLALAQDLLADRALDALPLLRVGEALYAPPPLCPPIAGIHILRAGVQLARFQKNRLEPAHALAMALRPEKAARHMELDEQQARAYLRGEPLAAPDARGWTLVCYRSLPLGWGKASEGWLKNKLPKGLRMRG